MSWEPEEAGRTLPRGCPALPCDTPILVSGLWNLVTAPWKTTTMHQDTSKLKTGLLRYETRSVCKPTPHLQNASRSATRAASDQVQTLTNGSRAGNAAAGLGRRPAWHCATLGCRFGGGKARVSGENGVEEMPRDGEIRVVHSSPADSRFVGSRSLVAPRCPLWGGVGSWTDPRGQEDAVLGSDLAPLLPQFPLCRLLEIINGNPARWGPRPCLI